MSLEKEIEDIKRRLIEITNMLSFIQGFLESLAKQRKL